MDNMLLLAEIYIIAGSENECSGEIVLVITIQTKNSEKNLIWLNINIFCSF